MRSVLAILVGVMLVPCWVTRIHGESGANISGIALAPGQVRITWAAGLDRYIVERISLEDGASHAVATSSGRVDYAAHLTREDDATAIYRIRQGLQAIPLADQALAQSIRQALGHLKIEPTNWLYDADLNALGKLDAALCGIRSLGGLGGVLVLNALDVGGNELVDMKEVGALGGLHALRAEGNGLTSLQGLDQAGGLLTLDLGHNQLADLSPLAGLADLQTLYLDHNLITTLAPLAGLLGLKLLDLSHNAITSIQPLIENARSGGLGAGDVVFLGGNQLVPIAEVAILRSYGVEVHYP